MNPTSWGPRRGLVVVAALAWFAYAIVAVPVGSAPHPPPIGIPDPGVLVRWGIPVLAVARDLSVSVVVGALVMGALLGGRHRVTLRRVAAHGSAVAALVAVLTLWFAVADVYSIGLPAAAEPALWLDLIDRTSLGNRQIEQAVGWCALALACLVLPARRSAQALLLVGGAALLMSLALTGHGAGASDHLQVVLVGWLHLLGAATWVGGVIVLAGMGLLRSGAFSSAYRSFAPLAAVSAGVVGVSGVLNAVLRAGGLQALVGTSYGFLVVAKTALIVSIIVVAGVHRSRLVRADLSDEEPASAIRAVLTEVAVMAVTIGVAVALSRTAP